MQIRCFVRVTILIQFRTICFIAATVICKLLAFFLCWAFGYHPSFPLATGNFRLNAHMVNQATTSVRHDALVSADKKQGCADLQNNSWMH
ncbi:MAG: hypothetical protein J3R72DRAFT_451534 [Linnemannia gamsii]|nr:MAG: hypothetical protein J3R72DRAFT_451534 [Linnemannia gamsii]